MDFLPSVGVEFVALVTNVTLGSSWYHATNQGEMYYDAFLDTCGMGVLTFAGFARTMKGYQTVQMFRNCLHYNMHGYVNLMAEGKFSGNGFSPACN